MPSGNSLNTAKPGPRLSLQPLTGVQAMLLAAFFFALMNLSVKSLPRLPTYEIVFFRALIMGLIGLGFLWQQGIDPRGQHRLDLLLRGLFGTLGLFCYFYTLKHMPLASAVSLQYLNPFFSAWLGIYLLQEKVSPWQWGCYAVAFGGVLLVKGFDARIEALTFAFGLLSAFFSGLAYNYVRKLRQRDHPQVVIFYFSAVSLLLFSPYTLSHWVWPQWQEWLWLGVMGALTYLAQTFMTFAYQRESIARVAPLNYTGLLYALLLGWGLFGESLSLLSFLGMLLIVVGVLFSQRQPKAFS